ncbi:MAG: efflux RND transporter periplasmic adaptor subunit [Pirellulaceae bacterium]|nr:efflux RND transporter periplasmic adaptor subunit [Pirellulaceae bacterium]
MADASKVHSSRIEPVDSDQPGVSSMGASQDPLPPPPRPDWLHLKLLAIRAAVFLCVGILLIVLVGLAQRVGWISAGGIGARGDTADAAGAVYSCPMHPQIRQPNPGRCPICAMPLELATTGSESQLDQYSVTIEPASRRLANIRTATVEQRAVERRLESLGRIAIDESRQATIAAYVSGRIERLFADYTGVEVMQGDHLAVIYSPQLYSAQVEYLESRRAVETLQGAALSGVQRTQQRLADGARQRLVELGMTADQLAELDHTGQGQSRITVYSPIGGTVIQKLLVEGKYVEVGDPIYQIANLSTVWLLLQLFPQDAAMIRFGQRVEVTVPSTPGIPRQGRVAFISRVVDDNTRTVDVRVELLNTDGTLRPGDYASAMVLVPLGQQGLVYDADLAGKWISPMHPQIIRNEPGSCPICGMDLVSTERYGYSAEPVAQPEVLVVPRRAVLMTGSTSLVYVETEPGRFEIRPVKLGPLLRDEAVIQSGVQVGEQVAVSGTFLIDSQMQLAGKPSLIDPQRAIARKPEAVGPMNLPVAVSKRVSGSLGDDIELLYKKYSALVTSFASDQLPTSAQVETLQATARQLAAADSLPQAVRDLASQIDRTVAHIHHRSLEEAREQFKSVSHLTLQIAAAVRGDNATSDMIHFYCSMVPSGGADWLQIEKPTANPYMGSKMLRCATHEKLLSLPPPATGTELK